MAGNVASKLTLPGWKSSGGREFVVRFSPIEMSEAESWTTLVGVTSVVQLSASDISIGLNLTTNSLPPELFQPGNVNFDATFPAIPASTGPPAVAAVPAGMAVTTGTGTPPVYIDFESAVMEASVSSATLQISQFVYLTGSFAFQNGGGQTVTVDTGFPSLPGLPATITQDVSTITVGGSDISAF